MTPLQTPLVCRLPAVTLALLGLLLAALAITCFPPVLRGAILVSDLDPGAETIAIYVFSLLLIVCAIRCGLRALKLWQNAAKQSPRRVYLATFTITLSGLLALAGLELVARMVVPAEKVMWGDKFQHHQWLSNRSEAQGQLHDTYASDRYDPELGWAPSREFRSPKVNTNSAGLRGLRVVPTTKPAGETRIVITGDSFSWGEDVADDEVYSEVLDNALAQTSVVNIAVHGYGTDQQFLRLKKIGFDYDPDLVILAYYKSNAARNVLSFRDYAKPRFRLIDGELQLSNVPVPAPDDPRILEAPRVGTHLGGLLIKSLYQQVGYTRFAEQWTLTRAILDLAAEETHRRGIQFALMYIPAARPDLARVPEAAEAVLAAWAEDRGEQFINLRLLFLALPAEQRERLYAGHWTPEGHRIVAGLLAETIAAERLLPRSATGSIP